VGWNGNRADQNAGFFMAVFSIFDLNLCGFDLIFYCFWSKGLDFWGLFDLIRIL
jgi:hypothetical protein